VARSRVVFHPEAAQEIEEARGWYREKSLSAEEGFLADLSHGVEQVAAAPLRWPRYRVQTRRYVFRRYPYSLVYRVYGDLVRVLAVAHDKRRSDYWSSRSRS
jgi:plasmid stabilization system protein ParE